MGGGGASTTRQRLIHSSPWGYPLTMKSQLWKEFSSADSLVAGVEMATFPGALIQNWGWFEQVKVLSTPRFVPLTHQHSRRLLRMAHLFWLCEHQLERITPFCPKSRGVRRADDGKVLSGSIHVLRHGLPRVDAPPTYGPHKTLYNRCRRWSDKGVFKLIFSQLARPDGTEAEEVLMMDATDVKAHPTASSLNKGTLNLG